MDEFFATKRVRAEFSARNINNSEGFVPGYNLYGRDGFQLWCPEHLFKQDYQPIGAMSFGHALYAMKAHRDSVQPLRVARKTWAKGFYITAHDGNWESVSKADMLADDWHIVSDEG